MHTELFARFRDLVEAGLPIHVYPGMFNLATVVDEKEEEKHELACKEYREELEYLADQLAAAVECAGLDSQPIYELVEVILEEGNDDDLAGLKRTVFALLRRVPHRTRGEELCEQLQRLAAGEDNSKDRVTRLRHAGTIVREIVDLLPRGAPYEELRYRLDTADKLRPNQQPLVSYVAEAIMWIQENYPEETDFLEREYSDSNYLHELKSGRDPEFLRVNLPKLAEFLDTRTRKTNLSTSTKPEANVYRKPLYSDDEIRDAEKQVRLIFDGLDPCPHDEKHRKLITIDELIISLGKYDIRKGLARFTVTRMKSSGELQSTKKLKPMAGLFPPSYRRKYEEVDAIELVPIANEREDRKPIASQLGSASSTKARTRPRSYRSRDELLASVITEAKKPDHPNNTVIARRLGIDNSRLSKEPFKTELKKIRDTMSLMSVAAAKGCYDEDSGQILATDPDAHNFVEQIDRKLDGF